MYPLRKSILYNPAAYYMIRVGFLSFGRSIHTAVACGRKGFFYAFLQAASRISSVPLPYISRRIKVMKKKIVALLCTVAMTCTLLAGCGQSAADTTAGTFETEDSTEVETDAVSDQEAANNVAALIDAIYVQERTDETDAQCTAAKEAWDALTDVQKELVAGEFADPDYFGRDTGDASLDDPRNQDEIGENEILVVSFGTSFNDSRVADIKGIEDALQEAYPDWSVRRAFTAQIIINHVQARDCEYIDNMQQALDRAVANEVKNLVIQPTHLMHGAEYDEMVDTVNEYADQFESVQVAERCLERSVLMQR